MSVQAKFYVASVTSHANGSGQNCPGAMVVLHPVYGDNPENKAFWSATPSGKIDLNITNPEAAKQFVVGAEYYVNFTKVGDE